MDDTWGVQREENNKTSFNTLTVLTWPLRLQWKTTRRMVPSPSWTPLVKPEADGILSVTVYRKPTHMDQYLQWDSHHHLSAKHSVINTLTHWEKQCVTNLSYSKKKWSTSGRHSPIVSTPNQSWTRQRKGLPSLPVRLVMGLTVREPQAPNPLPMKSKPWVI